jgi:hypothetical protein
MVDRKRASDARFSTTVAGYTATERDHEYVWSRHAFAYHLLPPVSSYSSWRPAAVLELGALFGALAAGTLADRYSRRHSIFLACSKCPFFMFLPGIITLFATSHILRRFRLSMWCPVAYPHLRRTRSRGCRCRRFEVCYIVENYYFVVANSPTACSRHCIWLKSVLLKSEDRSWRSNSFRLC